MTQTRPVSMLPKGTNVVRLIRALTLAGGMPSYAAQIASEWKDSPEIPLILRSVVEAGDTTTSGFASQLVAYGVAREFLSLLDGASIFSRLVPSMRESPFRIPTPSLTVLPSVTWTGESGAIPVTAMTFGTNVTLDFFKLTAIVALTQELIKSSAPSAESTVRSALVRGVSKATDQQFLDPSVSLVTGGHPASITNGATAQVSSGSTAAQTTADFKAMQQALTSWTSPFWIMSPSTAAALASLTTTGGAIAYPNISALGGNLLGVPVLTSTNVSSLIVLLDANSILFARDLVDIALSDQTTIEMDSTPALGEQSPVTTISTLKSAFQNDLVFIKVVQGISWIRGSNTGSVVYMSVSY